MRVLVVLFTVLLALPALGDDRGVLQAFIEDNLSDAGREVRITGFQGALSSTATIDEMTIADETGIWITLQGLKLDWSRAALLRGRLEVRELSAKSVRMERRPQSNELDPGRAEAREFALPDLPVSVKIDRFLLSRVSLGASVLGQEAVLKGSGTAVLADGAGDISLEIDMLEGPAGRLALDASYENETRNLAVSLFLNEAQGGLIGSMLSVPDAPSLALELQGSGPINEFAATLALASDGQNRVTGAFRVNADSAAWSTNIRLSGDLRPLVAKDLRAFFGPNTTLMTELSRGDDGQIKLPQLRLETSLFLLNGAAELSPARMPVFANLDLRTKTDEPTVFPVASRLTVEALDVQLAFDAAQSQNWRLTGRARRVQSGDLGLRDVQLSGFGAVDAIVRSFSAQVSLTTALLHNEAAMQAALGPALDAALSLRWQLGQPLDVSSLALNGQDYQVSGQGKIEGLTFTGDITAHHQNLAQLSGLSGQTLGGEAEMSVKGSVNPITGETDVEATGTARDLQAGIAEVDGLFGGKAFVELSLVRQTTGTHLRNLAIVGANAQVAASGRLNSLQGALVVDAKVEDLALVDRRVDGPAEAQLDLSWVRNAPLSIKDGSLRAMDATMQGSGSINLEGDGTGFEGEVAVQASDLSRFTKLAGRDLAGQAAIKASGARTPTGFAIQINGTANDLQTGIGRLNPVTSGDSALNIMAEMSHDNVLSCGATAQTPQLSVQIACKDGEQISYSAKLRDFSVLVAELPGQLSLNGTATRAADVWNVDAALSGPANSNVQVTGQVDPNQNRNDLRIRGGGDLALANAFIAPQSAQGRTEVDMRLLGPASVQALAGTVRATAAQISLPDVGISWQDGSLRADITAGVAQVGADGRLSTGGRVSLSGPVRLDASDVDLTVTASGARIRREPVFEALADAVLRVRGPVNAPEVSGTIDVRQAEISVPSGTTSRSGHVPIGLRHVGASDSVLRTLAAAGLNQSDTAEGAELALDVDVLAPARVFIRGRGLDVELGGQLKLGGTTRRAIPSGSFSLIRGRLDLLGRRLTMQQGDVTLQGALLPHIRLLAEAKADEFDVAVLLEGRADAPKLSISAQPQLPEDEALAVLLFGKRIETLSPLQAAQLAGAVATLAGQGDGIVGKIRLGFGLDDLDISSNADGDTAVSAGKYLSENVYTDITVGASGQSEINLNLDLLPNVTATGRLSSDGRSGIGIFWERDY